MKACIVLLAALLYANAASAKTFSFIYIEANEGDSSGGHVAVQFADEVFHYQYADGLIRLFRQPADDFRFNYRFVQNRPLHVADIDVSVQTFDLLHDHFKLSFFVQEKRLQRLQIAQQDIQLLHWLISAADADRKGAVELAEKSIRLPGAGFFYRDDNFTASAEAREPCAAAAKDTLIMLRERLEQRHGKDFLQHRVAELSNAIRHMSLPASAFASFPDYSFSTQYIDLMTGMLAIRTLLQEPPLTANSCHSLEDAEWRLDRQKIQALQGLRERLTHTALTLFEARRPDWGYALFVAMARLIAVEQTLRSGYWVFLDDFAEDSSVITAADFKHYPGRLRILRNDAAADWREQWSTLAGAIDERHYSRLEMAANRYREWALSGNRQTLRYRGEQPLPVKTAGLAQALLLEASLPQLQSALAAQEQYAKELARQLEQDDSYSLMTRNCVTEVLRSINEALGEETAQRLGGRIDPDLNIIPFTAFAAVRSTYHIAGITFLPSYRQLQLAQQYAGNFAPLVYAREANTFSASLYEQNPEDAWFVFFTDDALLLRPLFGAFNSVAGIAQSLSGLLLWPFDGGEQLATGARGLLMSLPELAFVNLRKGSYKYLSPRSISADELQR